MIESLMRFRAKAHCMGTEWRPTLNQEIRRQNNCKDKMHMKNANGRSYASSGRIEWSVNRDTQGPQLEAQDR